MQSDRLISAGRFFQWNRPHRHATSSGDIVATDRLIACVLQNATITDTLGGNAPAGQTLGDTLSAGEKQSLTRGEDQEKIRKMPIAPKLCGVTKNEPHL